jgi:glycosyltransferase involved in cell wall biosynthesis
MARILIIAYRIFTHDARLRRNAEALAQRGDTVDVVCLATNGYRYTGPVNVIAFPALRYRGKSKLRYLLHYLQFFLRAAAVATRRSVAQSYDLAMAISMPDAVVFGCLGAKLRGSKVILDITDMMPELYRDRFGSRLWDLGAKLLGWQERVSASAADRVLAVHELHRQRLEAAGINPAKIRVVMNSPDPVVFNSPLASRPPHDDFILIYHGSLIQRLGIDTAIEAIDRVRHRIPNIRLWILGTGDYLAAAQQLVARLKLEQHVVFHGFVPVDQISRIVANADIGLVPNHLNEATHFMLPMKLLEYAQLGIPVIAAKLAAIEYYFGQDSVRYFESGNAADLAQAIEELYRRPEIGANLSRKSRQVIETISWEKQREGFYEALDSLLAT